MVDVGDGRDLVWSFLVWERRVKRLAPFAVYVVCEARDRFTFRLRLEKRGR